MAFQLPPTANSNAPARSTDAHSISDERGGVETARGERTRPTSRHSVPPVDLSPPPDFYQNRREARRLYSTTRHQTWRAPSIGSGEGCYLISFLPYPVRRRNSMKTIVDRVNFRKIWGVSCRLIVAESRAQAGPPHMGYRLEACDPPDPRSSMDSAVGLF